jgi:hypothetical protein
MGKVVKLVGATAALVLLGRKCAETCGRMDFEKIVERMPENAPPRWIFRNISAIRENSERILELLEPAAAPRARRRPTSKGETG